MSIAPLSPAGWQRRRTKSNLSAFSWPHSIQAELMDYDSRIHQPGQSRINPCLPGTVPERTSGKG